MPLWYIVHYSIWSVTCFIVLNASWFKREINLLHFDTNCIILSGLKLYSKDWRPYLSVSLCITHTHTHTHTQRIQLWNDNNSTKRKSSAEKNDAKTVIAPGRDIEVESVLLCSYLHGRQQDFGKSLEYCQDRGISNCRKKIGLGGLGSR